MPNEEQGSRSIGSLLPTILHSLARSDATQLPSETNSGTTGVRSPDAGQLSSIGQQRTEIAAAKLRSVMVLGDPEATDRTVMASLPDSVRSRLREEYHEFIDPLYGYDPKFSGYEFIGEIPASDRAEATAITEAACPPATMAVIASELQRMRVLTKSRVDESDGLAAAAYASALGEYPPDVVVSALRYWTRNEKWWPAWAELKELLDHRYARRRALYEALTGRPLR